VLLFTAAGAALRPRDTASDDRTAARLFDAQLLTGVAPAATAGADQPSAQLQQLANDLAYKFFYE
jgi:hypothetical protein